MVWKTLNHVKPSAKDRVYRIIRREGESVYRIAIGDDDPMFLQHTEQLATATMEADGLVRGEDYEITCFDTVPLLMKAIREESGGCQLLLLDVEFGRENGLTVAADLRQHQATFSLIYITSHRDYVFDSFDTRPLHYLLKPVDEEKLKALIREDCRRQYLDTRLYLKAGSKHISLLYQDLYAVESAQHKVFFHLKSGTEEWTGSLRTLAPRLPVWCFGRCHNSYYINLAHVTEFVRYEARLDNGEIIPVSKRFYKSAMEQYIAFLRN